MCNTVTYRALGRDFTGRSDTLEALSRAKKYAQNYLRETGQHGPITVFMVSHGATPIAITKVYVDFNGY